MLTTQQIMEATVGKFAHTITVASQCSLIADSLKMNEEEQLLASFIGCLHDIGRITRIVEDGKFTDDGYETTHGEYGLECVGVNAIDDDTYDIVSNALIDHCKDPSDNFGQYTKILRDADKLAIITFSCDLIKFGMIEHHCETFLNTDGISYCKNMLTWFDDINYEWTAERLDEINARYVLGGHVDAVEKFKDKE